MFKPSSLLKSAVVLLVASLHAASLGLLFYLPKNSDASIIMGGAVPLQVHQITILGDSTVSAIETVEATMDEKIEEVIKDDVVDDVVEKIIPEAPVIEPEQTLITATTENRDHQVIKPIEKKVVKKEIVKNKPKPIKKDITNERTNKAQTISQQKPLVTNVSILKNPTPHYPRSSRLRKETGKVVVLMEFNEQGVPVNVRIERSSGYAVLDESALKAARSVRSRPYLQAGRAISFRHRMIYEFNLT